MPTNRDKHCYEGDVETGVRQLKSVTWKYDVHLDTWAGSDFFFFLERFCQASTRAARSARNVVETKRFRVSQ